MASRDVNYDESRVPAFRLPALLTTAAGDPVTDVETWMKIRRREIIRLFEHHVYGRVPTQLPSIRYEVLELAKDALEGNATRKQVAIHLQGEEESVELNLLLYLPRSPHPAPIVLGLNFWGNHAIHPDPGIILSRAWMRDDPRNGDIHDHRATEASRGKASSRWPVHQILQAGYGLATMYYGDIDPDFDDGFQNGVHALFPRDDREGDAWGAISAWAWGLSRALDYLETDPSVDAGRVIVMGHSRLGKTALWAGATDERFAMAISNNSGCGGAALSRRRFGETVRHINTAFPHWFCTNFKRYNDREDDLPVDQHMLIALMAPRPVYVASAAEDLWADPRGEFMGAKGAEPVYRLFGLPGLPTDSIPPVHQPVWGTIGYHVRAGGHDVTPYDWTQYLAFADRHLTR